MRGTTGTPSRGRTVRYAVGACIIAAVTMSASVAGAQPPGLPDGTPPGLADRADAFSCGDVYGGNGRMGILGGELYQAVSAQGSSTFTPTGGAPVTESFEQTWGKGPKGTDTVTCTQSDSGSDAEGSWEYEVTVVAVRVPGR